MLFTPAIDNEACQLPFDKILGGRKGVRPNIEHVTELLGV